MMMETPSLLSITGRERHFGLVHVAVDGHQQQLISILLAIGDHLWEPALVAHQYQQGMELATTHEPSLCYFSSLLLSGNLFSII